MKIIAVTACPTGIAHTYMAAASLEKAAKKLGHSIKVETQGAIGIENELSDEEINSADLVIFATAIPVLNRDRFENLKVVEISVQDAIKKAEGVILDIL